MKRNARFFILTSFLFLLSPINDSSAAEDSVYDFSWLDKDKEVYVLQNRKFRKKGKLTIGATIGNAINGAFIDSREINLLGSYFFKENWGFEFAFTQANGETNATHDAVQENNAVAFFKRIESSMSFMLLWSPFYSKINTFNKIFYYDWIFGAGLTSISTLDNRNEFQNATAANRDDLTSVSETALTWMTGLRFYINQGWSARMDFRAIHNNTEVFVDTDDSTKRFLNYYNFNLGLNYTF